MTIATQKNKPSKNVRFSGKLKFVLISFLILTTLGVVIGCSNLITKAETDNSSMMQTQSISSDIYWFVESFDTGNSRSDPGQLLLQYLEEQGDNLCIEALELFIIENIGNLEIVIDQEEAEETEMMLTGRIKETTSIKLPNGSTLLIIRYN